jgi:hypothetical protein
MRTILLLALSSAGFGQVLPALVYLDEVGHLNTASDRRTSVDLGFVRLKASAGKPDLFTGSEELRASGVDDRGVPWLARVPASGGLGWTEAWSSDFDANGRKDLLLAAYAPGNGRCLDRVVLHFLLFDSSGRPVPWTAETFLPRKWKPRSPPAILRDIDRDGRPELLVTSCEYSESSSTFGEDRALAGVYEAENARWGLQVPTSLEVYQRVVRANHALAGFVFLKPANPSDWIDLGNARALAPRPMQVREVRLADPGCRGVDVQVVEGALVAGPSPGCSDHLILSDGSAWCGEAAIVMDRTDGREILFAQFATIGTWRDLRREGRRVMLFGGTSKRCSLRLLWVTDADPRLKKLFP